MALAHLSIMVCGLILMHWAQSSRQGSPYSPAIARSCDPRRTSANRL